jgi:hypothetical protein
LLWPRISTLRPRLMPRSSTQSTVVHDRINDRRKCSGAVTQDTSLILMGTSGSWHTILSCRSTTVSTCHSLEFPRRMPT